MPVIKKYFEKIFLVYAALLVSFFSFAQVNSLEKITKSNIDYNNNHLSEKIYVHTDRSYYFCGDILWLKAYVSNAANNQLLALSKVAYVEILNKLHQPVLQGKIAIKKGCGGGSFDLPASLESGNYELRAYTNWMKNDSPDYYFKKIITIVNTTRNLDTSIIHSSTQYTSQFFPEGGNLVNGLSSVVGFKVNDNYGKGIDCSGIIVNESGDTITHFTSSQFGMGQFILTPQNGKHYKAVITLKDSSVITKRLPDAADVGYVMHVANADIHHLKITVQSSDNLSAQDLYLIATTNRHIDFSETLHTDNNQAILIVNKDSLISGMSQITLFNKDLQPLCERLWFKRPQNKMLIQAKADQQNYQHRRKVNIDLSTTNLSGDSTQGNLSVSVYRVDSLHTYYEDDIFSYLWLSSYCKGYVEDAGYYLKNDDAQTNASLDNLLLTQGWRTFNWETALHPTRAALTYIPENYGHIITGKITSDATGKPAPGVLAYLSVPGKRIQLYGNVSDTNGFIHFDLKDFYGANQVVLQTNTTKDSSFHLEIFSPFSEKYTDDVLPALHVAQGNAGDLQMAHLHLGVENTYHINDLQRLRQLMIDTLPFYYKPYKTYLLDNYTRFTTMEEVMREYVAEVNVIRRGKRYRFSTLNEPAYELGKMQSTDAFFADTPLMLLDGVPVFNADNIITYDPLKVQKLEVVTSRYYWGPLVADGIVSFTTYKGNLDGYTLNPHDLVVDYDGLQQQRIFYSPTYSSAEAMQSRVPDFRDVLYWSPEINTGKKGNGNFSFYTSDISGKYLVVLQGISASGDAGATSIILNVEK